MFNVDLFFDLFISSGASGCVFLITSLGLTADLIGDHVQSGALIYGLMSLTDKLSNGLAVVVIQVNLLISTNTNMYYETADTHILRIIYYQLLNPIKPIKIEFIYLSFGNLAFCIGQNHDKCRTIFLDFDFDLRN